MYSFRIFVVCVHLVSFFVQNWSLSSGGEFFREVNFEKGDFVESFFLEF